MTQYAGRAEIRVNGATYRTLAGATLNTGGTTRSTVKGYSVYGFSEEATEPTVECKIPLGVDTDLMAINAIKDATVEFVTDIGKTYMLIDAWRDGEPAKVSGNEVDVKFAAIECKEV